MFHKSMFFLAGLLTILFTAATIAMLLLSKNELVDILISISGFMLFLIQMISAIDVYKKHYKNGVMPILNPKILRRRKKYGKVLFILLADAINSRFIAIVALTIALLNHPLDVCWWLYMANIAILLFIKVFFGNILWKRYGEYISNREVNVNLSTAHLLPTKAKTSAFEEV